MDRDTGVLLLLIGFPLIVGSLAAFYAIIGRRAATIRCPSCGRRIPKTAITVEGVRCRHCDWCVKASGERQPAP